MMTELQTLADNCDVDGEFSCATGVLGASTEGREVRYLEVCQHNQISLIYSLNK